MTKNLNISIAEIPDIDMFRETAFEAAQLLSHVVPQVVQSEKPEDLMDRFEDKTAHVFVGLDKTGRVLGASMVFLHKNRRDAFIDEIGVLPGYEGRGIGRAMIETIGKFDKQHERDCLSLAPVKSVGFYHKMGFDVYKDESESYARKTLR